MRIKIYGDNGAHVPPIRASFPLTRFARAARCEVLLEPLALAQVGYVLTVDRDGHAVLAKRHANGCHEVVWESQPTLQLLERLREQERRRLAE